MLLTVSGTLSQFGDWISQHFAELGITISIPVLVGFICKLIIAFVRNKKAIKSAVVSATNTLKNGITDLRAEIENFKQETKTALIDFEQKMAEKIDYKFDNLKEKRKELYNSLMNGVDQIAEKGDEILDITEEKIEEISQKVIEQVDELPEIPAEPEEPVVLVNAEDVMR